MNRDEILNMLPNFYGTEHYYKLNNQFFLTDGTKYLAEAAGAFWLMDAVASWMVNHDDTFAVAKLIQREHDWLLELDDGNGRVFAKQEIEYSDFPLPAMKLYIVKSEIGWVIMLTSEY